MPMVCSQSAASNNGCVTCIKQWQKAAVGDRAKCHCIQNYGGHGQRLSSIYSLEEK